MMNKLKYIIWGIFIILIILGLGGIFLDKYTNSLCADECSKFDAVAWQKINSGNWAVDDVCICYLEDEIKLVRLGE